MSQLIVTMDEIEQTILTWLVNFFMLLVKSAGAWQAMGTSEKYCMVVRKAEKSKRMPTVMLLFRRSVLEMEELFLESLSLSLIAYNNCCIL